MLTFRNFLPSDIGRIMLMVSENFDHDYHPGFYFSMHSLWADGFIVARKNNEIAGFVMGSLGEKNEARILIMVVDKEHRYEGIGTALVREFVKRCSLLGLRSVSLEVRISNEAARKFYVRLGFQRTTVIEKYYLDGEDAYQLVKWL